MSSNELTAFIYDGNLIANGSWPESSSNRSFRYGDGVFETMRLQDSEILFVDDHFERLISGMYAIGLDTTLLNPLAICEDILRLSGYLNFTNARIRLSVFRMEGGFYTPDSDRFHVIIHAEELVIPSYQINNKGLRLGLFSEIRKPVNALSGVKSSNALLYVLASRFARDNQFDEALLLNDSGRICEASSSNIFLVLPDKRILTPPLSEGALPGVMRKNVIQWLRTQGFQVDEVILLTEDLYRAEEVFLTNVISGMRWVIAFREKRYFGTFTRRLFEEFTSSNVL